MVLSRRTVLLILGAILLASLAIRYPLVEHERLQSDSYFIHVLADSIVKEGHAKWTFSPLSYVGYYPFSYPSGVPFVLAEMSELTGLGVEACVLLMDMMLAVVSCLGAFLLARQFIMRPEFVLLAALFAVLGPRFIDTTNWDGSARGPLIVFVTLALFAAFRASSMRERRMFFIAIALGGSAFTLHHMAVLFVLFGLAYIIAAFQSSYLLPRVVLRRRQAAAAVNAIVIASVLVTSYLIFEFLTSPEYTDPNESSLFNLDVPLLSNVLNLSASYTNQIGFILPVAIIGMISMFRRSQFSLSDMFLFSVLVCFIPLLDRALYVAMVLTPFVAILGTLWIRNLEMSSIRKSGVLVLVVVLVASSIILPVSSNARWNDEKYVTGDTVEVGNQIFNDASYLRVMYPDTFAMSNNNIASMVLFANSDSGFLRSGIMLAIIGDITEVDKRNVTLFKAEFPTNLYTWYEYPAEPEVDLYVLWSFVLGMSKLDEQVDDTFLNFDHRRMLVLVDRDWPSSFVNQYGISKAILPGQLFNAVWTKTIQGAPPSYQDIEIPSYMIYQSGGVIVYALEVR
ncbi:MAG: hypothetical protein A3K60_07340 [Euryarchaeota archaeon RBG_19FT_COMBO_56_21]|nr:MAG: hypothetical protein A3K60_07340 [Euryarchaeota archaeon RBG_19FT_COMBO_56_21]